MLLSHDLDPAIGNINNQLDGAVSEIADWIQQTWEYSSPVKYEVVKEVIARRVTLRRVELWKKIRNGETKPSGLTDRTWSTLKRQLDNPASIRKSEDCRRANASRVNFGRTGPSGEVGVKQRLQRFLGRSPDPEEVSYEMTRDKGYNVRRKGQDSRVHLMDGSKHPRRLTMGEVEVIPLNGNAQEERGTHDDEENEGRHDADENDGLKRTCVQSGELVVSNSVASMSTEEISKHPFVLMMMQRLEALEGRTAGTVEGRQQVAKEVHVASFEDQREERIQVSQDSQVLPSTANRSYDCKAK